MTIEASIFPSSRGVAKIRRIFDGVVNDANLIFDHKLKIRFNQKFD